MDRHQRAAVAKRVTAARLELGITKKEAARRAGVSYRQYRAIEAGEHVPQDETLTKVMETLKIPPLVEDPTGRRIWLECHISGRVPRLLELFAGLVADGWSAYLSDLSTRPEPEQDAAIREIVRQGIAPGDRHAID